MSNGLKKAPNQLSTEELLKELESLPEKKEDKLPDVIEYKNDVLSYLSQYNILPGKQPINLRVLYGIYKSWSINPLLQKEFRAELNKYLTNRGMFFLTNQNGIKLTYEAYKKFKKQHSKIKSKKVVKYFEEFLNHFKLTSGTYWIEKDFLLYIYDKYSHYTLKEEYPYIGSGSFFKLCDIYFKKKFTKDGIVYGLSNNIVSCFELGQLERMRKDEYAKKKAPKKRNKKKSAKTSRPRS